MKYKKMNDTIYLRIDKDEFVIETIKIVCKMKHIQGGYFQGIGACDEATLATWIEQKKDFSYHTLHGMLEMVSLMGNISIDAGDVCIHSHALFAYIDSNGNSRVSAGHLEDAKISYTGEITVGIAKNKIGKVFDEKSGIDVWDL